LTPEVFEMRTQETINSLKSLVLKALDGMELKAINIDQVVLVGGGARLYIVKQILSEIFGDSTPLVYSYPPERAVANGAALWLSRPKFEDYPSGYEEEQALDDLFPINLIGRVYQPLFQAVFQDPFEPFRDLGYG
ncbi:MAG: Hsp70 family protein, partial [Bacteroidota bacterium]